MKQDFILEVKYRLKLWIELKKKKNKQAEMFKYYLRGVYSHDTHSVLYIVK